jgi:hypothetical protein
MKLFHNISAKRWRENKRKLIDTSWQKRRTQESILSRIIAFTTWLGEKYQDKTRKVKHAFSFAQ